MLKGIGRQPIKFEFLNVDFGDQRLTKRLSHLAELLDNEAGPNIPQACGTWKEIKAAYRFFANAHVDVNRIQETHLANTIARANDFGYRDLILVQDTTSFNYQSHPKTKNLGFIGGSKAKAKGIECHSGVLYTVHGTPLGIIFQKFWLRKIHQGLSRIKFRKIQHGVPIEQKESFRWLQVIQSAQTLKDQIQSRIILVQDREGDINEGIARALDNKVSFVFRVDNNRKCLESNKGSIRKYLKTRDFDDKIELKITRRKKYGFSKDSKRRSPVHRIAVLKIWWQELTIQFKLKSSGKRIEKISVILIDEEAKSHQPKSELLTWLLFTNQPIRTKEDARYIIKQYRCRWQIEEFHRVWKSGTKVEDCRLGSGPKLIRYLKVMAVIAWRQHYLAEIGREYPNTLASSCLSSLEIQAIISQTGENVEPSLTLGRAWYLISKIGGFMGRHSDHNPGPTTFWRGLQKIIYIAKGIESAKNAFERTGFENKAA